MNFSNLSIFTHENFSQLFHGQKWQIWKIQNHGGWFRSKKGEKWKTILIFACFLWFRKTRKLALINKSKHSFLVTPRGSRLHQKFPPPSSLTLTLQCYTVTVHCLTCRAYLLIRKNPHIHDDLISSLFFNVCIFRKFLMWLLDPYSSF